MGEGATQFHDNEGGGIGEGEGVKDVSDKIENEDQVWFLVFFNLHILQDVTSKNDLHILKL